MMTESLPFDAPTTPEVFVKIKKGIEPVLSRTGFGGSDSAWSDLVAGLCKLKPEERLPRLSNNLDKVRDHRWFAQAGFDWRQLQQRSMQAPYIPLIRGNTDLSHVDTTEKELPADLPYKDPGNGWDADF